MGSQEGRGNIIEGIRLQRLPKDLQLVEERVFHQCMEFWSSSFTYGKRNGLCIGSLKQAFILKDLSMWWTISD